MTFEYSVWTLQFVGHSPEERTSVWICEGEELCPDSLLDSALNAAGKMGFQLVSALPTRLFLMKLIPDDPEPVKPSKVRYFGDGSDTKCSNNFINPCNEAEYQCQREMDHAGNHWSLGLHWTRDGELTCGEKAPTSPGITRFCELAKDHEGEHSTTLESGKVMTWARG